MSRDKRKELDQKEPGRKEMGHKEVDQKEVDEEKPRDREIGEGDRVSARRYNKHTREFVEEAQRKGGPLGPDDVEDGAYDDLSPDELTEAEAAALERAKEQDPQVSRDYRRPTKAGDKAP